MEERYNRQIILPDFGKSAQKKLFKSKVLVVGAGGLGCSALQFLAAAGIGNIGIVDFDSVVLANLHRQVLFDENSIGRSKAIVAKERVLSINSNIKVEAYSEKVSNRNILDLMQPYQIIVDCTDNFYVRYILNDASSLLGKPLVYGSIYQYEGQVSVFNVEKEGIKTNYRDLFPQPPLPNEVPNCSEAGVLGTLAGMIGTLQANEVIKLITGLGNVLIHQLFIFNLLTYKSQTFTYAKLKENHSPKTKSEFINLDYREVCGLLPIESEIKSKKELQQLLTLEKTILVDVRNKEELPRLSNLVYSQIPLGVLKENLKLLESYETIVFVCQSGKRSLEAVQLSQQKYPKKNIKHILNGVQTII